MPKRTLQYSLLYKSLLILTDKELEEPVATYKLGISNSVFIAVSSYI